jgi:ferric-dicitrate binding protein FerR (iron transport regulator)
MIDTKIENIIVKFLNNQATGIELDILETWIQDSNNSKIFKSYIKTNYAINYNLKKFNAEGVKIKLSELRESELKSLKLRKIRKRINYAVAVSLVGLLVTAFVFKDMFFNTPPISTPVSKVVNTNNIMPGSDKAILTLEDGSNIELKKGKSFQNNNITNNGSQLIYESKKEKPIKISYNYLTIPRGGQFFIKLEDGTSVWLNSETQLKYPVAFIKGETRKVELVYGEAYFDVSSSTEHQGSKFVVLNLTQEVEVLGTEFNIKAYKDESNIYTTLVEGSIEINTATVKKILTPSQQSNVDILNNKVSIATVDVDTETSWKNGVFSFKGKKLKEIMKVLSRWYDVDVVFENKALEEITFKGVLGKDQEIEDILLSIKTLSMIEDFKIENKKIILK